jgi:biopolymer transport protein ExbD
MAPMIDVIFLLLTFFVLTAHLRRTEGFVPLPLVPAQSSESFSVIEPLRLELTALPDGCCVRLGTEEEMVLSREGAPEDFSALAERIERVCLRQQRRRDDPVELVCGDDVSWDFVVKVYDVLRVTGLKQITFVISDADEENAE